MNTFTLMTCLFLAGPPLMAQERVPIRGSALMAPPEVAKLLDAYKDSPDSARVARVLAKQAETSGFPGIPFDHLLVARAWRRAGEPELALGALDSASLAATNPMFRLERARVLLESDSDRIAGARAYWAACTAMNRLTRSEIEWDLLAATTPEERDAWKVAAAGGACDWLRDFWNERAQRMAISTDERVALHYRRLAHARVWYWIPRPRFSKGWSDFYGRPENLPLDDRGLIFVRMGAPDTDEGFSSEGGGEIGAAFSDDGDATESSGLGRCWPYWRPGGYRIFCFEQSSAVGVAGSGGDYMIQREVKGTPGTRFFHKYFVNSNLPKSAIYGRIRRAGGITSRTLDAWQRALDRVEARAYDLTTAIATGENMEEVLEAIPDVPEILSTVRVRIETLRFLNPSTRQWQVWLLSSVRAGDLTPSSKDEDTATLDTGGRYSMLADDQVTVHPLPTRSLSAGSLDDETGIPLRAVFSADPGPLPLTVVIDDLNAPGKGAWIQDTVNVPAISGLPQLSDIAVAQAEGGTWTRDGETYLQVSPAHITNRDGSIHTYFEVYGVRPGTAYEVDLRLVRADDAEDIWRLAAGELAFRLQFLSEMSGDIGRHHLRLELGDTKPGEYTLAVRIQDSDTRAYSLPAITDLFVAKR